MDWMMESKKKKRKRWEINENENCFGLYNKWEENIFFSFTIYIFFHLLYFEEDLKIWKNKKV